MQPSLVGRLPRYCGVALIIPIAALLLAGCSDPDGVTEDASTPGQTNNTGAAAGNVEATTPVAASASPADAEATTGGDGSSIVLSPLSQADMRAVNLAGELGCAFSTSGSSPILVAMGNVASREAAQGVVKVGSSVERVAAPGGFDAMLKGVTFSGAGKTIRITVTGPARGGGESPPSPAELTYDRADGAQRTYAGEWTCGP